MKPVRFVTPLQLSLMAGLVLASVSSPRVLAQDHGLHGHGSDSRRPSSALVQLIRESTERFRNPAVAEAEDYHPMFGCVTGDTSGAMGLHYVNFPLVLDGVLDPARPEIVIYEPLPNGRLRLIGADYLIFAEGWDKTHPHAPVMMGQIFHRFESPNRFGLPAFYTLHVWAWKDNPTGTFTNWHANVSCDSFNPQP